jgi:hypothetical protein
MRTPVTTTVILSANALTVLPVSGRALSVLSSTGAFTARVNNGPASPMVKGRGFGGPTSEEFNFVELVDTSGSSNTVILHIADEQITGADQLASVGLSVGAEVAIAAASLTSITPAAVTHTCDVVDITTAIAYSGKKSITITNTGSTDITITPNGSARTLAPGDSVTFTVIRYQDSLPSITVDATGGNARVAWLA